jgi:isoleucyl-tRNA synthetase
MPVFPPVSAQVSFPELETEILKLWKDRDVFRRSVSERPEDAHYTFYDGPPFATGLPHYGHLVASTLKDIVPRYWTMRGRRVERRFGWDTHGLPIEMQMEQELGLSGPSSVRAFGVAAFNEACRANVLKYTAEWEQVVTRLGRWVDFDNDYKTMEPWFMESVWWVFRRLWDEGLVYQDFRVMPYSWRLSTSLSNFEANLDYRDVQDPALTIAMPATEGGDVFLVWTTTPWTMPSNLAIAVGAEITYVRARRAEDDTVYIVAKARLHDVLGKDATVLEELPGSALVGRTYQPLFPYFADRANLPAGAGRAFFVLASGHVSTENGTGLVHMAPDFGEDDFHACRAQGIELLLSVDDEGRFTDAIADFAGRNIKEADPDIIRWIKEAGRLFRHDTLQHSYPFCWRSGTPLIYRALPAWFVRVTELRDRMIAHNNTIHWVPEAVGANRFGNWLADARDWNISRNRFWGTPIPIWRCEACGADTAIGSTNELTERTGAEITDLHPHRIDHLTFACTACGGTSRRIADVFDCWFESGAMPYAQGHYPFEGKEAFELNFPAEFIAEGLDQTRGWFYTLLVLSTALFDKPPFRNVIVNGMVLAEDGAKMSKSKKNYPDPSHIFEAYGADALRAYLVDSPIVRAEPLRFSERGVKEVVRKVLLPLRSAWSFFVQYANIDGWHPLTGLPDVPTPAASDRPELDRWLLSVQQSLVRDVNEHMEGYYLYKVVPAVVSFIDDLTNWYIRRSRRRFWRSTEEAGGLTDKASAYATLYEALVTFSKVLAPILPFLSEALYQDLVVHPGAAAPGKDSVHLCDFPEANAGLIDTDLEAAIATVRQVVGMGRALRATHQLKTRQPLRRVTIVHHEAPIRRALKAHADLVCEELNVKELRVEADADQLATVSFKANFKRMGRRYGKQMKEAATLVEALTSAQWRTLREGGTVEILGEPITAEDVEVRTEPRGDVVIETQGPLTVALDTELDEALRREGVARELVSHLQRCRKEAGLEVTDRIAVTIETEDAELCQAVEHERAWIADEVLAVRLELGKVAEGVPVDVDGRACVVGIWKG